MDLIAFMGLVSALALASLWRKRFSHAAAFAVVACGLAVMSLIATRVDGVIAFAVWTLASYALLNFPKAAALYLASAFCYILELQGNWVFAIQVACNILGLVGLAAIWYGTPRREYRPDLGAVFRGGRFVDFDPVESRARHSQASEDER